MPDRTVGVDCTEAEARRIANSLDIAAALLGDTEDAASAIELRDRFLAGIAISQAEQILRGR